LLSAIASADILGSDSRRIYDHILLSQIRYSPNLEGQVPIFISPGTGWPGHTPRHWAPFSSPSGTRRAAVEVFEPASTRGSSSSLRRICFGHPSSTSGRTEERTLSVTSKRQPLLGNSGKHVNAIGRQLSLYYCVRVGKSKCF
jgi:hypothetical protein